MAELADALDLGSSEATRTGSIPARCTRINIKALLRAFILNRGSISSNSTKAKDSTKDIENVPVQDT